MKKKLLTLGIVVLFVVVLFLPLTVATAPSNTRVREVTIPKNPSATRIYGLAIVNGTIKEPKSLFPIIGRIFGYKLFFYADFIEGIIKPVYAITHLRDITIPARFDLAVIHGTICKWDMFEKIEGTNKYIVSGKIIHLVVDLY